MSESAAPVVPEATLPVVDVSTPPAPHAHHHHAADGGCCSTGPAAADAKCETAAAPQVVALEGTAAPVEAPDELTLLNALKQVVDPELFVNIVDLGLIYSIQQEEAKVTVDMTLTSPACPAGPQIVAQAKQALEAVPGVKEATIKLVMTPPWSPDRMTDDARDHLGIF
jgi:metal-sulfur cluster biosynthetic enzyme